MFLDCFLDSSLIIEAFKRNKNAIEIISALKSLLFKKIYINEVVWSETVYQLCIKRSLKREDVFSFLEKFFFLNIGLNIIKIAKDLIVSYNLKPNDASIFAICKHYNIRNLIFLDEDFKEPCEKKMLVLIDSIEVLGMINNKE